MTDRFYVERKGVRPSEAIIDRKELERLRVMARRAADYEAAARSMRNAQAEVLERYRSDPTDKYAEGWLAAIRRQYRPNVPLPSRPSYRYATW